jgi:hypothetical protein
MKQRHPFDIYRDQYEALRELALEERRQGGVGSMSAMQAGDRPADRREARRQAVIPAPLVPPVSPVPLVRPVPYVAYGTRQRPHKCVYINLPTAYVGGRADKAAAGSLRRLGVCD